MITVALLFVLAQSPAAIEVTENTAIVSAMPANPLPGYAYIVTTADALKGQVYHVPKDVQIRIEITVISFGSTQNDDGSRTITFYAVQPIEGAS